jgi:C4-dicarboxylate transporter DctM subunit
MALFIIACMLGLMLIGVPVFFTLGITALLTILFFDVTSLIQLAQSQFSGLNSFVLLAIPFFILAGHVMVETRIAPQLFTFMRSLTGFLPGGTGVGAGLACGVFGAMTGSSAASSAALGGVVIPELDRCGYPRSFSAGLMAAGGTLAILIPPSIVFVIYAVMAGVSVTDIFKAAVIPGILMTLLIIAVTLFMAWRNRWDVVTAFSFKQVGSSFYKALPALTMPIIVLGGIYSGVFTPTEAAAVSAVYGIAVGILLYRNTSLATLARIFTKSAVSTSTILVIVAQALLVGLLATSAGIPAAILSWVNAADLEAWQFLLVVNIILIILGFFFDGITILTVATPLLLPTIKALDIDLIHFGIILTLNIEIACITPPVGMNLFVISSVSRTPLEVIVRGVLPFLAAILVALIVITYVPALSFFYR